MNNQVKKLEQLALISKTISNELTPMYDLSNMEIVFKVDRETMTKINEDMFYTFNPNSTNLPEETDEIKLEINPVKFKYILEEDE